MTFTLLEHMMEDDVPFIQVDKLNFWKILLNLQTMTDFENIKVQIS